MSLTIGELVGYIRLDDTGVKQGADRAEQRADQLARNVGDELDGIADRTGASGRQAGDRYAEGLESTGDRVGAAGRSAGGRYGTELGDGVAQGVVRGAGDGADRAGAEVETRAGRWKAGLATAGAAAGAAGGLALSTGLSNALELDSLTATLGAQLNLSADESERVGGVAGKLYADAYGESLTDVGVAISAVISQIDGMSTATDAELQAVTGQAMSLATTLGVDVGEAAMAVGQLVRTGLVANAAEGLDLMAAGAASNGNRFGDLAATISSSSGTLAQFGLDGKTAMGMITQSLDAGAPSADFFIGALEELAGNAGDSVEVFDALGLSGAQMAQDLNAGGPRAAAALDSLLDALRGMQDPAARSTALVGLFGEEATAMQAALLAVDPSATVGMFTDIGDAAEENDRKLSELAQNTVTKLQRGFEVWTGSMIATEGPLGTLAAGAAAFGPSALGMAGSVAMVAMAMGPMIAATWRGISALVVWVAQTTAQGALAVASMTATAARYVAAWILMGARALVQAAIMALAWIIGVVTPAASALISMAISAAAYIAHWVVMAAGAMARAAIMAAAWLVAMGPIGWVIAAVVGLVALIIANWDTVKAWTIAAWTAVTEWISQAWANIVSYVQGGVDRARGILEWFGSLPGRFAEWFGGVVRTVLGKIGELLGFIGGLPGRILGALGNLGSLLINAGRDIVTGLWNGIAGMGSWLMGQLMGWIRRVVPGPILQFLGIASPSKFMKNEVGRWIPEGLADGIIANSRVAGDAARALAADVAKKAQTAVRQEVAVDWGTVTEQQWDQLRGMGYKGRAGDSREALYVPADVLDKVAGSGKTVSITINNPQAERASDSIGRSGSTLAAVGPWGDD